MIAAIYARKSTDHAGAGDKSESVARQVVNEMIRAIQRKEGG
jgi:hypothetical protein